MSNFVAVSDREFATLAADVKHLTTSVDQTRASLKEIDGKVDGILGRFDRVDGGLKVAMAVSGFMGALAMLLLTKLAPMLIAFLPKV